MNDLALDLFQRYETDLLRFLRQRLKCTDNAADLLQETYLRIASQTALERITNPRAYLFRIAANLASDFSRNEARRQQLRERFHSRSDGDLTTLTPERSVSATEQLNALSLAVDELPPRCRQVFIMRKFKCMDQTEIAEKLGISRNMVEKHLRKALSHCYQRLSDRNSNA